MFIGISNPIHNLIWSFYDYLKTYETGKFILVIFVYPRRKIVPCLSLFSMVHTLSWLPTRETLLTNFFSALHSEVQFPLTSYVFCSELIPCIHVFLCSGFKHSLVCSHLYIMMFEHNSIKAFRYLHVSVCVQIILLINHICCHCLLGGSFTLHILKIVFYRLNYCIVDEVVVNF